MQDPILEIFGDFGAESTRRDKFQDHYAAEWCIKMLSDDTITEIVCEYGEDLVIARGTEYELHQVKTRQEGVGNWTITDLIPVVGKTFAMIPYLGNVTRCCFVSNEGANPDLHKLKKVLNQNPAQWDTDEQAYFDTFMDKHEGKLLEHMRQVNPKGCYESCHVESGMSVLQISTEYGHLEHIEAMNRVLLREQLEKQLRSDGITYTEKELRDVYESLLGMVVRATLGKTRIEKTIRRENVLRCVEQPIRHRTLYRLPSRDEVAALEGKTVTEGKLTDGGFTSPFVEQAREDLVNMMNTARKWNFGAADKILDDVRFRVKHIVVDSFDRICSSHPGEKNIGRCILDDATPPLARLAEYYSQSGFPVDEVFLRGMVWDLTKACDLYWSPYPVR